MEVRLKRQLWMALCSVILGAIHAEAQVGQDPVNKQTGVVSFTEPKERDQLLQHAKETYVSFGCAYCHGVDLKTRNGEATDLLRSASVGQDDNGNVLGKILRAGIPQTPKLSPMPQFSDLSDKQIDEIVVWMHYARQQGRYRELMDTKNASGSAPAGKSYFEKACASCHSPAHMADAVKKYDGTAFKANLLRPNILSALRSFKMDQLNDTKMAAARKRHGALLENYTAQDIANLTAYAQGTK
jgi:mono/diheme cytochrome c family protein